MVVPRVKTYSNGLRSGANLFCPMARKLLDLLVCPATRQPLGPLDAQALEALNRAIAAGAVRRQDGAPQGTALTEALITRDRKTVYRVDDGIPVLLAEEGIDFSQVERAA